MTDADLDGVTSRERDILRAQLQSAVPPAPTTTGWVAAAAGIRRRRRHAFAAGGVAAVVAMSGGAVAAGVIGERSNPPSDGSLVSAMPTGAATVDCGGTVYDPATLADAPPASSLPDDPAGAVDDAGAPAFDPTLDWKVVHNTDDRVDLIRELDQPLDNGGGDIRTHESRTLERITGAPNIPDGTWLLTSAGPCVPRVATGDGLGEADLTLTHTPSPGRHLDRPLRPRAGVRLGPER